MRSQVSERLKLKQDHPLKASLDYTMQPCLKKKEKKKQKQKQGLGCGSS
jgi:hypothetical protein